MNHSGTKKWCFLQHYVAILKHSTCFVYIFAFSEKPGTIIT